MVWAAIWRGGRSNLVIMERDETSKKNGYSSKSYIQCLEKELIPIYEPGLIFQQDNAKIHTSLETQEWFESHGIEVMEWPTHSPDLNPIEHCWNLLKKQLVLLYPNLFIHGRGQVDWRRFKRAIRAAWWSIPQAKIDSLINSMPRRVEEVY
jgi:transposase